MILTGTIQDVVIYTMLFARVLMNHAALIEIVF